MNPINYSSHYSGKFRNSNKIIRIFFLQHLRTTFEFLNLSFLLIPYFISTRTRLRATKFRFTTNIYTRAIRGRCTLSLFQCARRNAFLFPPLDRATVRIFQKIVHVQLHGYSNGVIHVIFLRQSWPHSKLDGSKPFRVYWTRKKSRIHERTRFFFFSFFFVSCSCARYHWLSPPPPPSLLLFHFRLRHRSILYDIK